MHRKIKSLVTKSRYLTKYSYHNYNKNLKTISYTLY